MPKPNVLMMIESSRESGRKLIAGITDYARHFGPWQFHWQTQDVRSLSKPAKRQNFDGVLARDLADVRKFVKRGIPTIAFTYGKDPEAGSIVATTDDQAIGESIARHFLNRGFRSFAYCGQASAEWAALRGQFFTEAVREAGFDVEDFRTPLQTSQAAAEHDHVKALITWLRQLPTPVAIMAANDDLGHRVVELCVSAGLKVPDDCAVVGVDNDPVVCGICNPPLSSIEVDQHGAGYRAAAQLDRLMRGAKPEISLIAAEVGDVVVRQSSDIVAVEDEAVSRALRFIQQNAHRPVTIDDIAQASGTYRRGLQRRFQRCLSQTIQQRYHEVRAAHLATLIRESQLSLEEISIQCGFAEPPHLTRFFATVRGETPSNYRRRMQGLS